MNPLPLVIPMILCVASLGAEPQRAVRGLAAQVEIDYAPRLRSRSDQTPSSPVLVRVSTTQAVGRQRVEFIGTMAGSFDLRDHLEREDGQPIADLPAIPITIVSQLPADHGVDLYATNGSWMNWRAHYREIMWGAIAFWAAVPIGVMVNRVLRRPPQAPPAPMLPPPPSVAEMLRDALEVARDRPLTVEESGRLELLLFRYLGGDHAKHGADLAAVLCELRTRQETAPLVLAIERWLHAKGSGDAARSHAAAALDELRRTRLDSPRVKEVAG
jgi:hypothetical protein